ncbi:SsgA family sporulation/cell division regulator [Micromonospora sp. S4605]|nr:SsgA family sporulation/cell division regulator [Micromonospora sp. S4605]
MSVIRPTTVEVETSLRLVAPDATTVPVRASLRYDPADPYNVHVFFHMESAGEAVIWAFARELIVAGLDEAVDSANIRIYPWATPRGDFVALALSSPDGNALFEVPRSVLVRFLRRTFVLVPRGSESETLDVDEAFNRLLRPGFRSLWSNDHRNLGVEQRRLMHV